MTANPFAPFIVASLALQLLATVAFCCAMLGLTIKLRHAPLRSASAVWMALTVLDACWLVGLGLPDSARLTRHGLVMLMCAAILVMGQQIGATARSMADIEIGMTNMRAPWRMRRSWAVAALGAAIGGVAHYWYDVVEPDSTVVRYLWLRSLLVLSTLWGLRVIFVTWRETPHARRRLQPLGTGTTVALCFLVVDGAVRYGIAFHSPDPWLPAAAVFSAFLGPFSLGIGFLVAALELEREHTRRAVVRIHVSLDRSTERERLQSLGRLAGDLAHDLHRRFSAITDALWRARGALGPEHAHLTRELGEAEDAVRRGTRLTTRLQAIAQMRPLRVEPFDVAAMTEQLLCGLRGALPPSVSLSTTFLGSATVLGDVGRYDQLLSNLVLNARDAMPDGGTISLRIDQADVTDTQPATRGHLTPGPYVTVVIEDNGTGIPASMQPDVFEAFVSTKGERGTGLGLATVVSAVHEMHGALFLDSELGRGTRFTIWLPTDTHPVHSPDEPSDSDLAYITTAVP
ncbi:ATP-binding protein [Gemmatimonas sp. UBA7669]|uniref:ATP-binding protein n=1 Tax=Gemmatimonas sp. UBA7669 TaxID=1946568 RepID=UPI0025BA6523|nr:ATP-binding protein [Gemmatimonas sp. UBA7669]